MSHWKNDKLNRKADAEIIIDTARKIHDEGVVTGKNGVVMAINAPWGGGKSYLLDGIAENLGRAGYKVLRFNAWENDYSKDALSSFLAEMGDQIESLFGTGNDTVADFKKSAKRIAWDVSKVFFAAALKKLSGAAIDELVEVANGKDGDIGEGASPEFTKDLFTHHKDLKAQIALLKKSLSDLYKSQEGSAKPIFILVDELDRCRPNFSIELLEAIKHIFQVDGICFLVAVNKEELINSIKVIYGDSFDSRHYLHRFFDVDYNIETSVSTALWDVCLRKYGKITERLYLPFSGNVLEYMNDLSASFKATPRDIEQICFKIYLLDGRINKEEKSIHIAFVLPILLAQQKNIPITLNSKNLKFSNALNCKSYDNATSDTIMDIGSHFTGLPTFRLFQYYDQIQTISQSNQFGVELLKKIHSDGFSKMEYLEQIERLGRISSQP